MDKEKIRVDNLMNTIRNSADGLKAKQCDWNCVGHQFDDYDNFYPPCWAGMDPEYLTRDPENNYELK
jgi:hypothetical protein